ncbi:MAG: hypothetical protein ACR2LZ_07440 [Pyrinomonadaceae bacterium]
MSIANELSCDVVAAMLARKEDQTKSNSKALTEIVLEFHSTLRHLTDEERQRRRAQILFTPEPAPPENSRAASGNH